MAHNYNSGYAVVDSDPNSISALQSGHKIKLSVMEDGSKVWRFVSSNPAGSKWVEIPLVGGGGSETLTSLGIESLTNVIKYTDENSAETEIEVKPVIHVTFAQLQTLISGNDLKEGQEYRITDFVNHYTQLESGILTTSNQIPLTFEPIIVKAKSSNSLHQKARSVLYDEDIIYYDINQNNVPTGGKGAITRREDTKRKIVGNFDWRHEQFRMYNIDVPDYNAGNTYNRYDIVKVPNGSNFDYYINVSDNTLNSNSLFDDGSTALTNQKRWAIISTNSKDPFRSGQTSDKTEVGQNFSLFNLTADTSSFVNRKAIDNPVSFSIFAGQNFNVSLERGVVVRDRIRNSTIKKPFGADADVVSVFSADNASCKVNRNSYVFDIRDTRQNITNAIVGVHGHEYTPYKSDDEAEDTIYGDIATSFALYVGIIGHNSNLNNSIISGSFRYQTRHHQASVNFLTIVATGSDFSGSNVTVFNGNVSNFKTVGVRLSGCIFGDLTQVYIQKTINADAVSSDKNITLYNFNFFTRLFRVLIKPDAIISTPNSVFQYSNINMTVPFINDSIMEFKKHPNNNSGGKGDYNVIVAYRDPSTKVLTMYRPVVDAVGVVTYEAY